MTTTLIQSDEPICRYFLGSRKLNRSAAKRSWLPDAQGRTSVYRVHGLGHGEIEDIGRVHVAQPRGKVLSGRTECQSVNLTNVGLDIIPDPEPHPRHANVTGWPEDKSEQLDVIAEFAQHLSLYPIGG